MAFLESFKTSRDFVRTFLRTGISNIDAAIASWGDGKKPWIFSEKVEEKIDLINDANVRQFVENLV